MKFGLLSYCTDNLGDDMQSIAARRFLPRVDCYVDREALDAPDAPHDEPLALIMNGWFCHRPDKWPPSPHIVPLLISFHVTNNPEPDTGVRAREHLARSPAVLRWLARHGPIGARDTSTLQWLRSLGIASWFSGCLTLTLDPPAHRHRDDVVVLNDLPDEVAAAIADRTRRPLRHTTHFVTGPVGIEERLARAAELIDLYARASCVVTTRLHGALPCLAAGTPVLLIDAHWDLSRFTGLDELVHHGSPAEYLAGKLDYDVDDPPPNPERHFGLRAELARRASAFVASHQRTTPWARIRERITSWI
jgi:Polysaccharide pyruvyl transferase